MNEKRKLIVVFIVSTCILLLMISAVFISLIQSNKKIEEIKEVVNSEEVQIIYLSKPTCYYCNLIEPITSSLEEEFDLEYFHINTEELSNSELARVLEIIGIDSAMFGTPYIAIVKNGELLGEQVGYTDEDVLFNLFKEYNLIGDDASLNMNYVDNLQSIWNQEESKLVLVGEGGDSASIEARILLRNLAKEHLVEINYFDIAKLEDDTEYSKLLNDFDVNQLPVLAIVKAGNILAKTTETTKIGYEKFLIENNYIK